jgi:hypothetical protein
MRKEGMADSKLPSRYLFPGITQRMIQRAMQRACNTARLRVRNPHDLRHTYATMLLMDHYSPAYVQKQLGHSSISITVDIYGHWIPGEGKMVSDQDSTWTEGKTRAQLIVGWPEPGVSWGGFAPMAPVEIIRKICLTDITLVQMLVQNWCKPPKQKD